MVDAYYVVMYVVDVDVSVGRRQLYRHATPVHTDPQRTDPLLVDGGQYMC